MKIKRNKKALPESFFTEKVGKYVNAESSTYSGIMKIEDEQNAKYLCHVSQHYFGFTFSELKEQPFKTE